MRRVEKPWGFELIWAETEHYVGKLLHINAGQRLSKQYHDIKEETVYVISGVLHNYDAQDKLQRIMPNEVLHVTPGQIHRFAAGTSAVEIIEVSTPHLDDVVRLADDYKR